MNLEKMRKQLGRSFDDHMVWYYDQTDFDSEEAVREMQWFGRMMKLKHGTNVILDVSMEELIEFNQFKYTARVRFRSSGQPVQRLKYKDAIYKKNLELYKEESNGVRTD